MGGAGKGGAPPPRTCGRMRARSTVLHGVSGGCGAPQGYSPNDMVNCVCNLPYGGVLRGQGDPGGIGEVLGEWSGSGGGFGRDLGVNLSMVQ